mmetsp:Transcript_22608/g.57383  ORF Transcript_22608/g.57383 Transcript_22608/m.57383 type:complete len:209 (+) Transcript_22608:180-806(+)
MLPLPCASAMSALSRICILARSSSVLQAWKFCDTYSLSDGGKSAAPPDGLAAGGCCAAVGPAEVCWPVPGCISRPCRAAAFGPSRCWLACAPYAGGRTEDHDGCPHDGCAGCAGRPADCCSAPRPPHAPGLPAAAASSLWWKWPRPLLTGNELGCAPPPYCAARAGCGGSPGAPEYAAAACCCIACCVARAACACIMACACASAWACC